MKKILSNILILFIAISYAIAEEKCIYKDSIQVKTNVEVSKTEIIKDIIENKNKYDFS